MANGIYATKQLRILIEDELTQIYALLEADENCPLGVQGWHHKTFPASRSVIDILEKEIADAVMWGQEAPPNC